MAVNQTSNTMIEVRWESPMDVSSMKNGGATNNTRLASEKMAHLLVVRSLQKCHAITISARIREPNVRGVPGITWSTPWKVVTLSAPFGVPGG